jgi:hypothetical protein
MTANKGVADIPLPLTLDGYTPGPNMDILVERLVFEESHWVQGWDVYRGVPRFSTDDGASLQAVTQAYDRVDRVRYFQLRQVGVVIIDPLPPISLVGGGSQPWTVCFPSPTTYLGPPVTAPALAEAVCRAVYGAVARLVLPKE